MSPPLNSNSIKIELGAGRTLYVIRQDGTCEVILSLVEDSGKVAKRTRILLSLGEAIKVSRAMAALCMMDDLVPVDRLAATDEENE